MPKFIMSPAELQELEARLRAESEASYKEFLNRPATKLLVSMVRRDDSAPPETLDVLLRTTFEAGSGHGTGSLMKSIMAKLEREVGRG